LKSVQIKSATEIRVTHAYPLAAEYIVEKVQEKWIRQLRKAIIAEARRYLCVVLIASTRCVTSAKVWLKTEVAINLLLIISV